MKNNMKKNVLLCTCLFLSALAVVACTDKQQPGIKNAVPAEVTMTKAKLFGIAKGVKEGWLHPDFIYVAWQGFKGMLSSSFQNGW